MSKLIGDVNIIEKFKNDMKPFYTLKAIQTRTSALRRVIVIACQADCDKFKELIKNRSGYQEIISKINNSSYSDKLKEKYINSINVYKKIYENKTPLIIQNGIDFGQDSDRHFVRYDTNIDESEKIPGLCSYIEESYWDIINFICTTLYRNLCSDIVSKKILVLLKKEKPYDEQNFTDEEVSQIIYNTFKEDIKNNLDKDVILNILKNRNMKFPITGRYYHSRAPFRVEQQFEFEDGIPYIVIYYRNISCNNLEDYKAKILNTLAHEYFHFVHDAYAGKPFRNSSWEAKAVKESLADYISVLYTLRQFDKSKDNIYDIVAQDKYTGWKKYIGTKFPYAEALRYTIFPEEIVPYKDFYSNECCLHKFHNVFYVSRDSMTRAYRILQG